MRIYCKSWKLLVAVTFEESTDQVLQHELTGGMH